MNAATSNAEKIALAVANRLFLRVDREYDRLFHFPARIVVIAFFLFLIVVSLPPVVAYMITQQYDVYPLHSMHTSPSDWLVWSKFASLLVEILFVLAISGTVFGEWVAVQSRSTLEEIEKRFEQAQTAALTETRDELASQIKAYRDLFSSVTVSNLLDRLWEAFWLSRTIVGTLQYAIPNRTARFLAAKFTVAFPGGLYGLVAFALFALLSLTKVVQIYAEQIASTVAG